MKVKWGRKKGIKAIWLLYRWVCLPLEIHLLELQQYLLDKQKSTSVGKMGSCCAWWFISPEQGYVCQCAPIYVLSGPVLFYISKCEFSALIETVVDETVKCNTFPPQSVASRWNISHFYFPPTPPHVCGWKRYIKKNQTPPSKKKKTKPKRKKTHKTTTKKLSQEAVYM